MKVLIVDDSFVIRRILEGMFRRFKINDIHQAGDGEQALLLVAKNNYDLIMLERGRTAISLSHFARRP